MCGNHVPTTTQVYSVEVEGMQSGAVAHLKLNVVAPQENFLSLASPSMVILWVSTTLTSTA